ncbi:hypothetical protein niasHT_029107 [Heterodera trifolii]|uniref:Uncharacterized protein n=1 Tax=Heterodera trifolii TaxID=157864 RepID=A0ABD2KNM8_9BILA
MHFQGPIFIFFSFLLLQFLPFSISDSPILVNNNSAIATRGDEDCSGCKAYKCMDESDAHCGKRGYLIGYGEPNCERFNSKEIYERFNRIGKKFINCTGKCLIHAMEQYILRHKSRGIDCAELKDAGFASHSVCYMDCNFCEVCKTNKLALLRAYRLRDFFSLEAIRQVIDVANRCGIVKCLFGNTNE